MILPSSPQATQTRLHWIALLLTTFLCLGIGALTLLPLSLPAPAVLPSNDKFHHFVGFACLALPAAILAPRLLWVLLPFLALYGALIEIVQPWVGRDGDLRDAQADALGLLVGLAAGSILRRLLRRQLRVYVHTPAE